MAVVLKADYDRLKAELDDTRESLVAALARVEAFRQREKLLSRELGRLRTIAAQERLAQHAAGVRSSGDAAAADAAGAAPAEAPPLPQQQQQQQQQPQRPAYITECGETVPIVLLSSPAGGGGGGGGAPRRTPAGVVVTPAFIDFVELRARVKREQFVGIGAAPPLPAPRGARARFGSPRAAGGGDEQFLPSAAAGQQEQQQQQPAALWQALLSACLSPGGGQAPVAAAGPAGPRSSGSNGGGGGSGGGSGGAEGSGGGDGGSGDGASSAYQVIWRSEHRQHALAFEATREA